MSDYISLLRGINVGGHAMIRMDALAALYGDLGFRNIKTYIQSGNVIFDCTVHDARELGAKIEEKIKETLGFDIRVILRTPGELRSIIRNDPFRPEDTGKAYVAFLSDIPAEPSIQAILKAKDDAEKFLLSGKEIYLYYPNGVARSKMSNSLFEKCLHVASTTRNWNTVNRLCEMAHE